MSKVIKKSFERMQKVTVLALCVVLAGSINSCGEKAETSDMTGNATGIVIGSFFHGGIGSLLVQVDKKYPIGKTIKYDENAPYGCVQLSKTGTYLNMIQIQPYPHLPLSDYPEEGLLNKRISFSYREYQRPEEGADGDYLLFIATELFPVVGLCTFPEVPIYIITDCQILN